MNDKKFKAMVVNSVNGNYEREISGRKLSELPAGDLMVEVKYSSLNYKDALSATGNRGVTRHYPHTPGIDAAGVIVESASDVFNKGDQVIVSGFDLGMDTDGGFGQYVRVPAEWAIKLPDGLTLKESMIFGTAGFTAALAVEKMKLNGTAPSSGEILVTGATGGLGSLAVAILAKLGFNVVASTGKRDKHDYLKELGAQLVLDRSEIDDPSDKALLRSRWAGVIDCVGGTILTTAIRSTKYGGNVAACGLTQSPVIKSTVYPFILRGVNLLGIDSAHCGKDVREKIWVQLAGEWKPDYLTSIYTECSLNELGKNIDLILQGKITGRVLVNPNS